MPGRIVSCITLGLGALLLMTQASRADALDTVKQRGKLVVGVKNDYPPFGSLGADGKLHGFEIDLAHAVARHLLGNADAVELVPVVASNRIELLNAGRIDVIFATLGQTPERAKVLDFTTPYYMMEGILLLTPKAATITTWEQTRGHTLCGIQGSIYNRALSEKYGATTLLFAGTAELFKAFQDNRCEAIAFDGPILRQKITDPDWAAKYKIAVGTFDQIPIAGGLRRNEPAFLAAIDKAIVAAEADGVLVNAEKTLAMGESDFVTKSAAEAKAAP